MSNRMIIYCLKQYNPMTVRAIICSPEPAEDIDDDQPITVQDCQGKQYKIRQKGYASLSGNPEDAFSDQRTAAALERALQNSAELETDDQLPECEGHFFATTGAFAERSQKCTLRFADSGVSRFPAFTDALKRMRDFEELLGAYPLPGAVRSTILPHLSEDLIAKAAGLRVWAGLVLPFFGKSNGQSFFGVLRTINVDNSGLSRVDLSWVDGPELLTPGTTLKCWSAHAEQQCELGELVSVE